MTKRKATRGEADFTKHTIYQPLGAARNTEETMSESVKLATQMEAAGCPQEVIRAVRIGTIGPAKARRMLAAWSEPQAPKAPKPPQRVASARTPPDTRTAEERLSELEIFHYGASRAPSHDSAELRRRMNVDRLVPGAVSTPHRLTLGSFTEKEITRAKAEPEAEGPRLPEAERRALGLRMGTLELRSDGVENTPHKIILGAARYRRVGTGK